MINDKYMNLIKDAHKSSYMAYKKGKKLIPFSSHQPILIHTLNTIKTGKVLEYGMGWGSTPIIHTICGMQNRKALSVETNINWMNKFLNYQYENHELLHLANRDLCKWDHELFKDKYSIAFIDGHPEKVRNVFIEKVKNNVDYFVVHDTEEALHGKNPHPIFSYEWDFSGFKHQYHMENGGPASSLLSNLDVINKNLLTIFE